MSSRLPDSYGLLSSGNTGAVLRRALRPFIDNGTVTLPDEPHNLLARTEEIAAEASDTPPEGQAATLLVGALVDGKDVTEADYAAAATAELRRKVLARAAGRLANLTLLAMGSHAEEILEQVDAAVVAPALATLTEAAEHIEAGVDASALIRDRRVKDAERLAAAQDPALLASLRRADDLRRLLVTATRDLEDPRAPWPWLETTTGEHVTLADKDADAVLDLLRDGARLLPFVRTEPEPSTVYGDEVGLIDDDEDDDERIERIATVL